MLQTTALKFKNFLLDGPNQSNKNLKDELAEISFTDIQERLDRKGFLGEQHLGI